MASPAFQRARSAESKQQRARSLVDAARSLALEKGVAAVTLSAIAERAGVHHSAMRRYFDSHKDVLLQLAAEGWHRWADETTEALRDRQVNAAELARTLVATLAADPLFCDLLANVPLHLEHEVTVDRVVEFKKTSREAVLRLTRAIATATPSLGTARALDVVTAANALAATLWQATHPAPTLRAAFAADPTLTLVKPDDFRDTLTRLLTATCAGLTG
ncbi:transcriptional regulator [Planotetraspora thailandica]|uniref:Transcriptional regulator n=1 Tax=Planotetraspora thailandica TaxID=487172 RepID=A0A8J3V9U9_9ACTN|nr:TetR family transcriptional regulator [Planotetraspora thailandica]GII52725.1 transcriptional regulator [Planotetraspora thailandica]